MSINKFITNLDLARQAEILSGETAVFQGGMQLGLPFSGFPSGVDTSTIVSLGVQEIEYTAFSGGSGTTLFDVINPSSPYYSVSAATLSASPYTIIDVNTITETVSATTYSTIMTFTALSGDCCSTPISVSFTPPIIQELYDRGLYDGLFNGLGQATIGTTYIDQSFYNVGSVFSGANLDMEIIEYGVHGSNPSWATGTTSGTVIEYSALTQYWSNPIYENLTSGLTLPITPISAETQTSDYVWTLTDTTIIDDNLIGLQYTGYNVTYSFDNVIDDPATQTYIIGGVTSTLEYFSAGTLDYKNSIEWLKVRGNATIDERLTTDRLTINTLGTGSPVTMLAVDINGNVVGGTGGTTDDTGAFTSTTVNNTIIPTNAVGNTNDSDYASILGGQNNTISGTSTSASIVGGENNVVKDVSDFSIIAGGEDNTISGHTHSFIIGGSGNTINYSAFLGDGEGIVGSTNTIIEGSKNTLINSSADSGIYGGQLSSIQSSYLSNIYNDITAGGENLSNTIIGSRSSLISGTTGGSAFRFNSHISTDSGNIYDSTNTTIIAGRGDIHNTFVGGIFGGSGTISASTSQYYSVIVGARNSELYDSSTSGIIVGNTHTLTDSESSGIFGGESNVINNSDKSSIIGGTNNLINSANSFIGGGQNNLINHTSSGYNNSIIGGTGNIISGTSEDNSSIYGGLNNYIIDSNRSTIIGGSGNLIEDDSDLSTILGGLSNNINGFNSDFTSIIGGSNNIISSFSFGSSIVGGDNNYMTNAKYGAIIGGEGNFISNGTNRSVILGGQGITGSTDNTVYVPNLNIGTLGGGTSVNNLGIDSSGNVVVGSSGISGSGVSNQVTYWDGSNSVTGDNKLTFTPGVGGSIFKIQQSTNNFIELNPQSLTNRIRMYKDGGSSTINLFSTDSGFGSFMSLNLMKDSISSPNPIAINDVIGNIIVGGTYQSGNTNTSTSADIQITASETWSPTTAGSTLRIRTKQNGASPSSSLETRVDINGDGTNYLFGDTQVDNLVVTGTTTINSIKRQTYTFTTTDATPYVININIGTQLCRYIKAIVIGNASGGNGSLGGEFTSFYDEDSFGSGTTLLSSTGTLSDNMTGTPAFSISDIAEFTATGIAATTIDWKVIIEYSDI